MKQDVISVMHQLISQSKLSYLEFLLLIGIKFIAGALCLFDECSTPGGFAHAHSPLPPTIDAERIGKKGWKTVFTFMDTTMYVLYQVYCHPTLLSHFIFLGKGT